MLTGYTKELNKVHFQGNPRAEQGQIWLTVLPCQSISSDGNLGNVHTWCPRTTCSAWVVTKNGDLFTPWVFLRWELCTLFTPFCPL